MGMVVRYGYFIYGCYFQALMCLRLHVFWVVNWYMRVYWILVRSKVVFGLFQHFNVSFIQLEAIG